MKKLLAIILAITLMSCVFVIPVGATDGEEPENGLYYQTFLDKYLRGSDEDLLCYEELYYSKNYKDELEWVFVHARIDGGETDEFIDGEFCGVQVLQTNGYSPFEYGYGIYDVKKDEFVDLPEVWSYNQRHPGARKYYDYEDLFQKYYNREEIALYDFYRQYLKEGYPGDPDTVISENVVVYDELYYHYSDYKYGDMDWILVRARLNVSSPIMMDFDLGNVNIYQTAAYYPFEYSLGVYDCREHRFYDIKYVWDSGKYDGLPEQFKRYYEPDNQFDDVYFASYNNIDVCDYNAQGYYKSYTPYKIFYRELYHHYNDNGDIDWVFVFGQTDCYVPDITYYQVGNRLINVKEECTPFSLGYGVYDVEDGKFYDITQVWRVEKYAGMVKLFENACDSGLIDYRTALTIGDWNFDGIISVNDATQLQRYIAGLEEYPTSPELQEFINQKVSMDPKGYVTFNVEDFFDVNNDGIVSISDATKLQRITAEFDS